MRFAASFCALAVTTGCIGDPVDPELTTADRRALQAHVRGERPRLVIAHEASFGGRDGSPQIELVGYLLEPRTLTHAAGTTFTITFVWKLHERVPDGYRLFTHLVDQRGRMLVNLDTHGVLRARPGSPGSPFPPSRWPTDGYVLDTVKVAVPKTAPRKVRVLAGFYRGGSRLPAWGDGVDAHQAAAVIQLAIKGGAKSSDVPELTVPRLPAGAAIQIDGSLDEPAWRRAASTGAFVSPSTGALSTDSPVQGSARILYDEEHLYVSFVVDDRDIRGGFEEGATDPHLWTRDTVEIMLDPDGDGDNRDYYEIQIGPQNLVFDSRFDDYNQPRGGPDGPFGHQAWSAQVVSSVTLDGTIDDPTDVDGGYVVEAKIPFASLNEAKRIPPTAGDRWRANFYAMQNNGGVSWSPILGQGNFHKASRFGRLIFQ